MNRKRFRLWDQSKDRFHGSSSYPTRPVPRRVAARRARAPRAHRCGQRGRGCRTLAPDTEHRTPNTGHRTPGIGHRALDTEHRTPDARTPDTSRTPDTGQANAAHGTLTEDADRRPRHGGIRTSWYHDTAGTPNRVAVGGATGGARQHDGSAVRPPASTRDCRLHCQAAARSLPPAAKRRLGALLSSDDFGSSVERDAAGQVLWRAHLRAVLWRVE